MRYKCLICGMEFDGVRWLIYHFESNHRDKVWWLAFPRYSYWRIYRYLRQQGWVKGVRK